MFDKVLVVCVGNICRSPIAERAMAEKLPGKTIHSAGIASQKSGLVGKPADSKATEVAAQHGLDITQHTSQQLTPQMCSDYDLILVMEKGHIEAVSSIAPEARGKTMLLGHWNGQLDIPDPFRQSKEAFDHVFKLIDDCTQRWCIKLGG
ncbi:low molecular weight protein-tyrosine-phosphatase [Vibrio variabilis]|uniref:low molecular weight protein-tyrosine-phosphatase n=1 Tax=Vibrio variabilis TaxID=990271 RepID=UPI000DDA6E68|nr:low molecular weight protein-tyrosine-phosphatase [Vibrio variabilis]